MNPGCCGKRSSSVAAECLIGIGSVDRLCQECWWWLSYATCHMAFKTSWSSRVTPFVCFSVHMVSNKCRHADTSINISKRCPSWLKLPCGISDLIGSFFCYYYIVNKTCLSEKLDVALINVWLLQQITSSHNIAVRGTYNLDGYDIKVFNQNLWWKLTWFLLPEPHCCALLGRSLC